MQAPFPYFGGKAAVAPMVWEALGQPKHYIEPFFGSGAVLLARPDPDPTTHIETVCDKDGFLANVWRALQADPDEVARYCDWPVNHADLNARRRVLVANEGRLLDGLSEDPDWYDAKLAGYWVWAASCWIGSGLTCLNAIPHVSDGGKGVHKLGKRPHVSTGGKGVHKLGKRPHVGDGGKGVDVRAPYNGNIYAWFRELSERLRYVRVVCGDWTRVCGGKWQCKMQPVGMFFDPPYGVDDRSAVYSHDSTTVAHDVAAWCLERGADPRYRIVLAGYEEHQGLLDAGWTARQWKTTGGYGQTARNGKSRGQENRFREVLYFSPHSLQTGAITKSDPDLFSLSAPS